MCIVRVEKDLPANPLIADRDRNVQSSTSLGSFSFQNFLYSSQVWVTKSSGQVRGTNGLAFPRCSNFSNLDFVNARLLFMLYTLILCAELVTCRPQFHAALTVSGCVLSELSQHRHTISIQPSTSQGKSNSQVRHVHLCFLDMFSLGTAYQLKPPSAESSIRSGHRPPPEYAQPLHRILPLWITTCFCQGDMMAEETGISCI